MELEFGHLVFKGEDDQYTAFGENQVATDPPSQQKIWDTSKSGVKQEINNYQDFKYLDYNWEWNNSEPVVKPGTNIQETNVGNKYVAPSARNGSMYVARSEFGTLSGGVPDTNLRIQNPPLKYNQQASSILFRFSVKLVHLF